MNFLKNIISEKVKIAFNESGYDESFGEVHSSNRPDLGDFQCNGALAAAKKYGQPPMDIADCVTTYLKNDSFFDSVEYVNPGFINIKVRGDVIADYIIEMSENDCFGFMGEEFPYTAIIDYGGANVAKPLHVGHLRSAVIGESIKRIVKYCGNTVYGDVHLGDWGLQMGLIIEQLKIDRPDLCYFQEDFNGEYPKDSPFTLDELEKIYPKASARSKEDEDFLKAAQEATLMLQQGYEPYREIWKHIMNISKEDLKKNYDNLLVDFEIWKGESDAQPYIDDMIDDLISRGIAYESQGATVIDVAKDDDKKEIPPCIIRKSDGASLYATSDLATIIDRRRNYNPRRIIYVADKRQELHFNQVFRAALKSGIACKDMRLDFLGFGTMNGADGKPFKTRQGGVMRLSDLISDINSNVKEKMVGSETIPKESIEDTVKIVGLAALKYGDLSNQASKDYIFDVDRFSSLEGNTGPYILYTVVRIRSILSKYMQSSGRSVDMKDIKAPISEKERALMLKLSSWSDVMNGVYKNLAPHELCRFIYEVSDIFNGFYHDTKILSETDENKQKSWLALISITEKILTEALDLLGIETAERM